jgi:hypothetical protein
MAGPVVASCKQDEYSGLVSKVKVKLSCYAMKAPRGKGSIAPAYS